MRPVSARAALLVSLLRHRKPYGLELIHLIREDTGGLLDLSDGNIYPVLLRLAREGLVKAFPEPRKLRGGSPPRTYYTLTAAGRKEARESMAVFNGLMGVKPREAR